MTVWLSRRARFRNAVAAQRKRHIERGREERRRIAIDDVGSNAQPIRLQLRITYPRLQVGRAGRKRRPANYRPRCGQKQEIAPVDLNFGPEEIVIRWK